MVATFNYSDAWSSYAYGREHPLKPIRPQLTCELVQAYALLTGDHCCALPALAATLDELARFHKAQYLNVLQTASLGQVHVPISQYGLGPGDNPVFPGLFRCSSLIAGASLQAAQLTDAGAAQAVCNITGGLHHGTPSRASGFSYVNDVLLAIDDLLDRGYRVAYINIIDTHHGDGLQAAYYHSNQVLTISLHESGKYLFPGRGFDPEIGQGPGLGYAVNVPLHPHKHDEVFTCAFRQVVPPFLNAFRPSVIVTQLGEDTFRNDPLSDLKLTTSIHPITPR